MAGILLPSDAQDTVSSVAWSPTASHLAVASWDHGLRVYDVSQDGRSTRGLAMLAADGPLLSCDWAQDGTTVVAAGADGANYLLHVPTGTAARVGGHHTKAVRAVRFVDAPGGTAPGAVYASGSWDGTVRYWDVRRAAHAGPLGTLACGARVYALDARDGRLVVATAAADAAAAVPGGSLPSPPIQLVDLRNPTAVLRTVPSPLRHQTRDVAVRPGGRGWATASIEGRVGISTMEETDSSTADNYTFRCHRTAPAADPQYGNLPTSLVYAVNTVRFHPVHATTAVTGGSDGVLNFWDIAARCRLRTYSREALLGTNDSSADKGPSPAATTTKNPTADGGAGGAIMTAAFRRDGALLAYAVGYDWHRGHQGHAAASPNRLMVLPVPDDAVRPRKR